MLPVSAYIWQAITVSTYYECNLYMTADQSLLRVDDIIIDSSGNDYNIFGYYNPSDATMDETNSLFQDGWKVKLNYITNDVLPQESVAYDATVKTPDNLRPGLTPTVSWGAIPGTILPSFPPYTYQMDLYENASTDPGAGEVSVGYYYLDNLGNIYEIIEVVSASSPIEVRVKDISESGNAPDSAMGVVYDPLKGAIALPQANMYLLSQVARDKATGISNALIWEYRGVAAEDGVNPEITEITRLNFSKLNISESTPGWQGGNELLVEPQVATDTQDGIVTVLAQSFSGHKTFEGEVTFNNIVNGTFDGGTF